MYAAVANIFRDAADVFPSKLFHLGGDEVVFECWKSNKDILRCAGLVGNDTARGKGAQERNVLGEGGKLGGYPLFAWASDADLWKETISRTVGGRCLVIIRS